MSEEIPADIMRAAHLLLNEIAMCAPEDFAGRRALVERAILAERQRCAKVAEEWPIVDKLLPLCDDSHNEAAAVGQTEAGERIAQAILKGEPT